MWLASARHIARFRHVPDWHHTDGFWFCMRCVKRGRPAQPQVRDREFRVEWSA